MEIPTVSECSNVQSNSRGKAAYIQGCGQANMHCSHDVAMINEVQILWLHSHCLVIQRKLTSHGVRMPSGTRRLSARRAGRHCSRTRCRDYQTHEMASRCLSH